jgi:hypothetical protein
MQFVSRPRDLPALSVATHVTQRYIILYTNQQRPGGTGLCEVRLRLLLDFPHRFIRHILQYASPLSRTAYRFWVATCREVRSDAVGRVRRTKRDSSV